MKNIPDIKLGLIAVSRDCFPIALSTKRRQNIMAQCGGLPVYECPVTVADTIRPDPAIAARYEERYQQFKKIYPTLKGLFPQLR